MASIEIDGHVVNVRTEIFERHKTMKLIARVQSGELAATIEFCDLLFECGYDGIGYLLDPVNGDPRIEESVKFIETLFTKLAGDKNIKNSYGSQNSHIPASQHSEPTYNDTSGLTTTSIYLEKLAQNK